MKTPKRSKSVAAEPARPLRGRKTWREKLADDKDLPKIVSYDAATAAKHGGKTCAIPAPREINALMRLVPRGKLITIDDLRVTIAKRHDAAIGCPITTGIFAWMSAHAADEAASAGDADITPYWRTLKAKGELNPKYPGGIPAIAARLETEGHSVDQKGKRWFVRDFARSLFKLPAR